MKIYQPCTKSRIIKNTLGTVQKLHHPDTRDRGKRKNDIGLCGGEEVVLQKMMDVAERDGYVNFPLGFRKLRPNFSQFYCQNQDFNSKQHLYLYYSYFQGEKCFKFIKKGIFLVFLVYITYAGIQKFRKKLHHLLGGEGGVSKKMILDYVEGGGGLKTPKQG